MLTLVVGGFLGSGKTTTIINMGKYIADRGYTVAIIVNEIGEIGIDGDIINKFGFDSKEITNGCICCTLKVSMRSTVTQLYRAYDPDILLVEPTGIAFPNVIKTDIELMNLGEDVQVAPLVTLIDGSRFKYLMKEVKHFSMRQIEDAEILAINKVDLMDELHIPIVEESVQQLNKKAKVVKLCAKADDVTFHEFMKMLLPEGMLEHAVTNPHEDVPDKAREAAPAEKIVEEDLPVEVQEEGEVCSLDSGTEDENSILASGVATYAVEYEVDDKQISMDTSKTILSEIMDQVKARVMEHSPEFLGHIKMFLDSSEDTVRANVTAYFEEPTVEIIKTGKNASPKLKILSAVSSMDKEKLVDIVDSITLQTFEKYGVPIQKKETKHHHHHHDHDN
jgi:G3E family GTPase